MNSAFQQVLFLHLFGTYSRLNRMKYNFVIGQLTVPIMTISQRAAQQLTMLSAAAAPLITCAANTSAGSPGTEARCLLQSLIKMIGDRELGEFVVSINADLQYFARLATRCLCVH